MGERHFSGEVNDLGFFEGKLGDRFVTGRIDRNGYAEFDQDEYKAPKARVQLVAATGEPYVPGRTLGQQQTPDLREVAETGRGGGGGGGGGSTTDREAEDFAFYAGCTLVFAVVGTIVIFGGALILSGIRAPGFYLGMTQFSRPELMVLLPITYVLAALLVMLALIRLDILRRSDLGLVSTAVASAVGLFGAYSFRSGVLWKAEAHKIASASSDPNAPLISDWSEAYGLSPTHWEQYQPATEQTAGSYWQLSDMGLRAVEDSMPSYQAAAIAAGLTALSGVLALRIYLRRSHPSPLE